MLFRSLLIHDHNFFRHLFWNDVVKTQIHRHNINNYFLCKVKSFGEKNLTQDEIDSFHLSTLQLSYEEAVREYENRKNTRLGTLVANRELPILYRAKEIIDDIESE